MTETSSSPLSTPLRLTRRRRLLIALPGVLLLPPGQAVASGTLLDQVRQRLADAPVLRGEFEQRKTLKGFKNPLLSRGDFLLARDRGVIWRTRQPFASELVVTGERLLTRQTDGRVGTQVDTRREPGVQAVNEMLFALMAADVSTLSKRFKVDGELRGPTGWRLMLVPTDSALASWLTRIELDGERFVNQARWVEAQGDTSVIQLSAQSAASQLSADEAARFD